MGTCLACPKHVTAVEEGRVVVVVEGAGDPGEPCMQLSDFYFERYGKTVGDSEQRGDMI